jgi:hypothetical protein
MEPSESPSRDLTATRTRPAEGPYRSWAPRGLPVGSPRAQTGPVHGSLPTRGGPGKLQSVTRPWEAPSETTKRPARALLATQPSPHVVQFPESELSRGPRAYWGTSSARRGRSRWFAVRRPRCAALRKAAGRSFAPNPLAAGGRLLRAAAPGGPRTFRSAASECHTGLRHFMSRAARGYDISCLALQEATTFHVSRCKRLRHFMSRAARGSNNEGMGPQLLEAARDMKWRAPSPMEHCRSVPSGTARRPSSHTLEGEESS